MAEDVGIDSPVYQYVINQGASMAEAQKFASNVPLYWGDQPIVEAPAYLGAIVFFLAVFCLFADRRKIKYAFLAGIVLTLLLSWGKNLAGLTTFFIHYIPLYGKSNTGKNVQPLVLVLGNSLGICHNSTGSQCNESTSNGRIFNL